MFQRILIANRGEIAVRILRACRELGVDTVAVYSSADADALHVQLATQAVCIGPAKAADSYLNVDALLTVARQTGCDALHPGYGFLSENAEFAQRCADLGLTFIGPSGDVIRMMGNKSAARELMQKHNVPVVPGSDGAVETAQQAQEIAEKIGYPVLVKASAGGGVVTATVSGKRELKALEIDPDAVDPDDVEMLEDLIVAAVNEAMRAAEGDAASTMQKLTGGLGLPF